MLIELKVSQFAIIENIHIRFNEGLNIISGETGAGKSIILKSLGLLMGEKSQTEAVKTGAHSATIEGLFDLSHRHDLIKKLEELGIETLDEQLIVRRIVAKQGKSRIYLNGSLSPLSLLREIVSPLIEVSGQQVPLIEMTGQHENKNLQSKAFHLDIIDSYLGLIKDRQKIEKDYFSLQEIKKKIHDLKEKEKDRLQKIDFLNYQNNEIQELNMKPGDEVLLENKLNQLKNATQLIQFTQEFENHFYSKNHSVLSLLQNTLQKAEQLSKFDKNLKEKVNALYQAQSIIEDCVFEMRDYASNIDDNELLKNEWEEKLDLLRKLQKKYGTTVEEILQYQIKIQNELKELENSDRSYKKLVKESDILNQILKKNAQSLHEKREKGSSLLTKSVNHELKSLNMKGVQFLVKTQILQELHSHGMTSVEFMIQSSKKDEPRPLSKYASGGELSRILLSLKYITGKSTQPRTYLFDEVDAGVSGETAEKVGQKLHAISKGQQVICVTHLPQVAAQGDYHLYICKSKTKDSLQMEVIPLSKKQDRIKEVARLISGEKITKTSLKHAEELLNI